MGSTGLEKIADSGILSRVLSTSLHFPLLIGVPVDELGAGVGVDVFEGLDE